jgi:hypothetical protein
MALADLRAFARAHKARTHGTREVDEARSGHADEKPGEIRGLYDGGTHRTRGTHETSNVDANVRLTPSTPRPPQLLGTTERTHSDGQQAALVSGLLHAARRRPPSWADPTALPSRGCFCSCCKGQRWWREREAPKGWRCWTCHPTDHLATGAMLELRT